MKFLYLFFGILLTQVLPAQDLSNTDVKFLTLERPEIFGLDFGCIAQDHVGVMWLGAESGLYRYDGIEFKKFNDFFPDLKLSSESINCLLFDAQNEELYIGTNNGLNILNFSKNLLTNRFIGTIGASDGWSLNTADISQLKNDENGNIWIVANGKLVKMKTILHTYENYSYFQNICDLGIDKNNTVWISDKVLGIRNLLNRDICRFEEVAARPFRFVNDQHGKAVAVIWKDFCYALEYAEVKKKAIAIPFQEEYKAIAEQFAGSYKEQYPKYQSWLDAKTYIFSIYENAAGHVWILTRLGVFVTSTKSKNYFVKNGVPTKFSLRKISKKSDSEYKISSYSGEIIWNKTTDQFRVNTKTPTYYDLVEVDKNTSWMLTDGGGMFKVESDKLIHSAFGMASVRCCLVEDDTLWTPLNGYLFKLKKQSIQVLDSIAITTRPDIGVNIIVKDWAGDKLWIGAQNGLYSLDKISKKLSYHTFSESGRKQAVTGIVDDNNFLWVATTNGLFRYDKMNQRFEVIEAATGLKSQYINTLLRVKNNLWVSTNAGISAINMSNSNCYNFSTRSPQLSNEYNFGSCYYDQSDNTLLYGGINGLTIIKPDEALSEASDPSDQFLLQYASWHNQNSDLVSYVNYPNVKSRQEISLSAKSSRILFYISSADFLKESNQTYKYRLRGYDDSWTYATKPVKLEYLSLPSGVYYLEISTSNSLKTVAIYKIVKEKEFYKRTEFFVFLSFILMLIGFFINYYLNYQKDKIIAIKSKIARNLHDEVGGIINNISILSKTMEEKNTQSVPVAERQQDLQLVNKLSEEASYLLSNVLWSIDPAQANQINLKEKIQDIFDEYLKSNGINYRIDWSESLPHQLFDVERNFQVLLTLKEGVTNTLKHSHSQLVVLAVEDVKNQVHIKMTNYFDRLLQPKVSNQIGLVSIKERIEKIGGKIAFLAAERHFELSIQLKK